MTRDYFIKHSTDKVPNNFYHTYVSISGDSKDAKDIVSKCLPFCIKEVKDFSGIDIKENEVNIHIFSLLQTT